MLVDNKCGVITCVFDRPAGDDIQAGAEFLLSRNLDLRLERFQTASAFLPDAGDAADTGEDGVGGAKQPGDAFERPDNIEALIQAVQFGHRRPEFVDSSTADKPFQQPGNVELQVIEMSDRRRHKRLL